MMTDEKLPPTTASSASSTMHEKPGAGSTEKTPEATTSAQEGDNNNAIELNRTRSAADVQQEELNRVMTSADGVEYPTGVKLQLISLALCLSVFLMALVCFC